MDVYECVWIFITNIFVQQSKTIQTELFYHGALNNEAHVKTNYEFKILKINIWGQRRNLQCVLALDCISRNIDNVLSSIIVMWIILHKWIHVAGVIRFI